MCYSDTLFIDDDDSHIVVAKSHHENMADVKQNNLFIVLHKREDNRGADRCTKWITTCSLLEGIFAQS